MGLSFYFGTRERLGSRGLSRLAWIACVYGIAILFGAAAFLQYRLNLQIKQAMESRLGADLESVMVRWHLDLYREFSTICIALQVGPDSGGQDKWSDFLRRFEEWRSAASRSDLAENLYSNPDIVDNIYIYDTSRGIDARLMRLDPYLDRIETVKKPEEMKAFLTHLRQRSGNLRLALRAWEPTGTDSTSDSTSKTEPSAIRDPEKTTITGWQFEESIPAIVHPILHHTPTGVNRGAPVDWLIVVLNRDVIARRVFPELASRYFEGSRGLEYKLAVISLGRTTRLLYSSDATFGVPDLNSSDSVMNIFGRPPEST